MKAFSLAETTWIIIIYIRHASYNPSDVGLCELRLVQFKPTPCNKKKLDLHLETWGSPFNLFSKNKRVPCSFPRLIIDHVLMFDV
jgi:hypothetical protein